MSSSTSLPTAAGGEAAVFTLLTTRDEKIPGTPFYSTKETLEFSADENVYHFEWNGTYLQMLAPGTTGEGLTLPGN